MTPAMCRVKHDPENNQYGDCVRACVASIMDMDAEAVPHFFDNIDSSDEAGRIRANNHMREWLAGHGHALFQAHYPGSVARDELFAMMEVVNPGVHYILCGSVGLGDHCVVCRGGKIVHNPAWLAMDIIGPCSYGAWSVMVIARA